MKNSIIKAINNLKNRVAPMSKESSTMKRSDGISQTVKHDTYSSQVQEISKNIANSKLSLGEKLELNEMLNNHLPI